MSNLARCALHVLLKTPQGKFFSEQHAVKLIPGVEPQFLIPPDVLVHPRKRLHLSIAGHGPIVLGTTTELTWNRYIEKTFGVPQFHDPIDPDNHFLFSPLWHSTRGQAVRRVLVWLEGGGTSPDRFRTKSRPYATKYLHHLRNAELVERLEAFVL